jgi:hypothetical protein
MSHTVQIAIPRERISPTGKGPSAKDNVAAAAPRIAKREITACQNLLQSTVLAIPLAAAAAKTKAGIRVGNDGSGGCFVSPHLEMSVVSEHAFAPADPLASAPQV